MSAVPQINVNVVDGLPEAPQDDITYGRRNAAWVDMTSPANLQFRQGTAAEVAAITPFEGEPVWATDTKVLVVGDGQTQGGVQLGSRFIRGVDGTNPLSGSLALDSVIQASLSPASSVWFVSICAAYRLSAPVSDTPQVRLPTTGLQLSGIGLAVNPDGTTTAFDPAYKSVDASFSSSSNPNDTWHIRWDGIVVVTSSPVTFGFQHTSSGTITRERGFLSLLRIS
jgi:hypothetical protein